MKKFVNLLRFDRITVMSLLPRFFAHTIVYIHNALDNVHKNQAQGSNLRSGRSLGGKRTVDINDEQTDGLILLN